MVLKILNRKSKNPPNPRLGSCSATGFWWISTFIDGLWEVRTFFVEVADPQKYMNGDKWVLSWGGGLLVLSSYSIAALTTMNRLVPNLYQGFLLLFGSPKIFWWGLDTNLRVFGERVLLKLMVAEARFRRGKDGPDDLGKKWVMRS